MSLLFRARHASMEKNRHQSSSSTGGGEDSCSDHSSPTATDTDSPGVSRKSESQEQQCPLPPLPPSASLDDDDKEDQKQLLIQQQEQQKKEVNEIISSAASLDTNLLKLSEEVDEFLETLTATSIPPPEIPEAVEKFAKLVQVEIVKCVSGDIISSKLFEESDDEPSILDSIDKISRLTNLLGEFEDKDIISLVNLTSTVVQRAMSFLEEEFRTILDIPRTSPAPDFCEFKSKKTSILESIGTSKRNHNHHFSFNDRGDKDRDKDKDRPPIPIPPEEEDKDKDKDKDSSTPNSDEDPFPGYSVETVQSLKKIAATMISSGYETECCQVYSLTRRNAFEDSLNKLGFEKISIDDVQKMQWETLESQISIWIKVFKKSVNVYFPGERKLCEQVFAENTALLTAIFNSLTRSVALQLLNFAEAIAMTKRSAEKLFKCLDMYETLVSLIPSMDEMFHGDDLIHGMGLESQSARSILGEAAVAMFCDLENSIKSDSGKTPVPGGAVHPVTRYTTNYITYACEYKDTLEQIFREHRGQQPESSPSDEAAESNPPPPTTPSPFLEQLTIIMDLLDSNIETKSKLYKEPSLNYIFLMNNGRYILQKIKESDETYQLLGSTWSRKKSTDMRHYHKNYQRDTWSKVLACFKDDGLQVNGKVAKPVLKERFKSFNNMFEEIHRTQSQWNVSDKQLQSELQVSITAVIIPAYRSFLGRFRQYLEGGRHVDKYIKYGPEDIETQIGQLFNAGKKT